VSRRVENARNLVSLLLVCLKIYTLTAIQTCPC